MSSEEIQDHHGKNAVYKDHQLCTAHTLFDPIHFSRATVLSDVGGNGCSESNKYGGKNILQFSCCRETCHIIFPVYIDRTLHHNDSDRGDGKLQCHRNTQSQKFSQFLKRNCKVFFFQMKNREFFHDIDQA